MTSGIYSITHESGQRYIGSSVDIPRRLAEHYMMLCDGAHHCWRLQKAWTLTGGAGFQAEILEYCQVEDLAIREQSYIDQYDRNLLYNTRLVVDRGSTTRVRRTGPFRNDPVARALGCPSAMMLVAVVASLIGFAIRLALKGGGADQAMTS